MFDKNLLERVLATAMKSGADFAEIYAERTRNNSIRFVDGKIDRISDNFLSGVGIRAFLGTRSFLSNSSTAPISNEICRPLTAKRCETPLLRKSRGVRRFSEK